MSKSIIIIGAGISGLSALHFLHKKHANIPDVHIELLEKNDYPGGTIRSLIEDECLFEIGPNGFLDKKTHTLELISDLELEDEMIDADLRAQIRFVNLKNSLFTLPRTPQELFKFPLFSIKDKCAIVREPFIPKGTDPKESVNAFAQRRFGVKFADLFLDPLVSGVYAGDSQKINLKAAFPKIYELEQTHGSLLKAMIHAKKNRTVPDQSKTLFSFKRGMGQLIEALSTRYTNNIKLNTTVTSVGKEGHQYILDTSMGEKRCDEVFICVPAYVASQLLPKLDESLSKILLKINYAPLCVVGLVYFKELFKSLPKGFGYLIPSKENNEVLGVLFESNIFSHRAPKDQILFRAMIGGVKNPKTLQKDKRTLVTLAHQEIKKHFAVRGTPSKEFYISYPKAIPQYEENYFDVMKTIDNRLSLYKHLHLLGNYRGGVAFNDCIENAYLSAQKSTYSATIN